MVSTASSSRFATRQGRQSVSGETQAFWCSRASAAISEAANNQ
ncbi:hypothetical protein [Lentzea terrae]